MGEPQPIPIDLLPLREEPATPSRASTSRAKRVLDVTLSSVALVFLSPFFLLVAAAIKLESPGPAIFVQWRSGLLGRPFLVYKFRTMKATTQVGNAPAERDDPRITRLGRILRRTSIDELPQLWNVVRGDMSLVGPRPHAVDHDLEYLKVVDGYGARFGAKPGITGLSQINGSRGGGDVFEMRRRAVLDGRYIADWSFSKDLKILLMTIPHLVFFRAH
jgi:putative colanic acid biosynthesis UDP-glucose lipid carrier transferase